MQNGVLGDQRVMRGRLDDNRDSERVFLLDGMGDDRELGRCLLQGWMPGVTLSVGGRIARLTFFLFLEGRIGAVNGRMGEVNGGTAGMV